MSLFVLSSKDGWVSIMYQGIDAVAVDIQVENSAFIYCRQIWYLQNFHYSWTIISHKWRACIENKSIFRFFLLYIKWLLLAFFNLFSKNSNF